MKRLWLFLQIFFSISFGNLFAQERDVIADLELLKSRSWSDGYEFVKYTSPEIAKEIWNMEVDKRNTLAFIGGTLHEGGTTLILKYDNHSIWTDKTMEYQLFPSGDKVSFDEDRRIVMFRDPDNNSLHGILKPLTEFDGLKEMMIDNIRRLILAGTYKDVSGRLYKFSAEKNIVEGLSDKNQEYQFAIVYDFPQSIILVSGKAFGVNKTKEGLELIPARLYGTEGFYEPIPGARKLSLKRIVSPNDSEYSLLSKEYLTLQELSVYAGSTNGSIIKIDWKIQIQQLLDAMSVMRNEIFARHGYIFKSARWKDYFGSKTWYKPTKTDVNAELSNIEKINIELIKQKEKNLRKQLNDF